MEKACTHILMIADNHQDVMTVKALLSQEQRFPVSLDSTDTLSSGLALLEQTNPYDLVLIDLDLAGEQGLTALRQVYRQFPQIPLMLLSGDTDVAEAMALDGLQIGAQDYLIKGQFDGHLLSRAIHHAIEQQQQRLILAQKTHDMESLSLQLEEVSRELEQLSTVDQLTQVLNRRRFDELLLSEWNRLIRERSPLSLIMCDVDCFKAYNQTYGQQAGDQCLQQIARTLRQTAKRPADSVARYQGEEFVVILPHTDLDGATHVAEDILAAIQALNLPHSASAVSEQVTLSLGVASRIPSEDVAPSLLVEAAERALFMAKDLGHDRVQVHRADLSLETVKPRRTLKWVTKLRQALETDQFSLYAQPIKPLHTQSQMQHLEILIRIPDQTETVFCPQTFLPVAEQYDFMPRIDRWVVQHLFSVLADFPNLQNHQFYVNLSGASFEHNQLLAFIHENLHKFQLRPDLFCFEVTESIALDNLSTAIELMNSLKAEGCRVALDDFGSGMSSFTYLKSLPVDFVKIDGSFVQDMSCDPVSKAIVESIHNLAKVMGLETIAEFVDSEEILNTLCDLGVDYAQGNYFDYPKPLEQILQNL